MVPMRSKEELLLIYQDLILSLRDRSTELQLNEMFRMDWSAKFKMVKEELATLNSCDSLWFSEEYSKWHKKEIEPLVKKVNK